MTEVINRNAVVSAPMQQQEQKDSHSYIPEIIEETRIDSLGKADCQKYVRGKLLGKGGFGRCYVGTVMSTKVIYALKIVPKSTLVKSKAKQKLQSEIRIHRNLRHIHIVRFERYFEDIHNVYIVLELCSNNSMSELLKRRKRLLETEVRFYLYQLVESLKYLHQALIIHRDLKLGNLFLDSNLKVKVGDFGLAAKLSHVDERKRTVCGTPNYLAPEILEGKDGHSFEVDIWSTGVVMYTLLVGKPPFESKDMKSTYKRILSNSYTFPDHITISEDAKGLIRSMLQHRPDRRPSLDEILSHAFFIASSSYMPATLPESSLKEAPVLIPPLSSSSLPSSQPFDKLKGFASSNHRLIVGDENDANAINRMKEDEENDHMNTNANSNLPLKPTLGRSVRSSVTGVLAPISDNIKTQRPLVSALTTTTKVSGTVHTITAATLSAAVQENDDDLLVVPTKKTVLKSSLGSVVPNQTQSSRITERTRTSIGSIGTTITSTSSSSTTTNVNSTASTSTATTGTYSLRSSTLGTAGAGSIGNGLTTRSSSSSSSSSSRVQSSVVSNTTTQPKFDVYDDIANTGTTATAITASVSNTRDKISPKNGPSSTTTGTTYAMKRQSFDFKSSVHSKDDSKKVMGTTTSEVPLKKSSVASNTTVAATIVSTTPATTNSITSSSSSSSSTTTEGYLQKHISHHRSVSNSNTNSNTSSTTASTTTITNPKENLVPSSNQPMDELQLDIETMNLGNNENKNIGYSSNGSNSANSKKSALQPISSPTYTLKTVPHQAWTANTQSITTPVGNSHSHNNNHNSHHQGGNGMSLESTEVCTPPDQIIPAIKEPKGTLEEMHDMLDHSYINNTNFQSIINNTTSNNHHSSNNYATKNSKNGLDSLLPATTVVTRNTKTSGLTNISSTNQNNGSNLDSLYKVWVVRYVDYTSKYGLGFLLNNGCAGVYFNDSTKIIVSADGITFQYIERVKRSKDSKDTKDSNSSSETYNIQTHLMSAYPMELQKKVTLLRHFRNYLIEQQRLCAGLGIIPTTSNGDEPNVRLEDIYTGGPTVGDEVQSLPMLPDIGASNGANAMIKFGQSSIKYSDTRDYINSNINDDKSMEIEMPYVKKWVRTKHAILFRMSNRTVQVLFFDKSEILLSSEAQLVTYVNKQSMRSEHSLDEVMQTGRTDIAKRLRYTKDIMYRLIHLQSK